MGIPNNNSVLTILNYMVKPRNTHGKTRGIVIKLTLNQQILGDGGEEQRGH